MHYDGLSIVMPFKGKPAELYAQIEHFKNILHELELMSLPLSLELIVIPHDYEEVTCKNHLTVALLQSCKGKLRLNIINAGKEVNVGEARKIGIESATKELIYFIDSDCNISKNSLSTLYQYLQIFTQDPKIAALCGPVKGEHSQTLFQKYYEFGLFSPFPSHKRRVRMRYWDLLIYHHPVTANLLVRKDVLKKLNFSKGVGEDIDIILQVLRNGYEIIYDPGVLVHHRHRKSFKGFVKHFFRNCLYYPDFIAKHKLNPILVRRIILLAPYVATLLSLLIIPFPFNVLISLIFYISICFYYLKRCKDLKVAFLLPFLDILVMFIIAPVSFCWRLAGPWFRRREKPFQL